MTSDKIRISHFEEMTEVLGPGKRFAIWFQGCDKRCSGCINPEGWDTMGGYEIEISGLIEKIISAEGIQGITISGGEPFLQFDGLKVLVEEIKRKTSLDIMLFSGYTYMELKRLLSECVCDLFFQLIDIFVDGEYIEGLNGDQMYRGSSNQKIYYFTPKYTEYETRINNANNRDIEFTIDENSQVFMIGIPPKGFYKDFLSKIKEVSKEKSKEK